MYYIGGENIISEKSSEHFGNMDISLKSIGYFVKVVECGNVSKAAEGLYVSQPYLSKNIKSLEERLGFDLFTREKNRLVLTTKGTEFYKSMRPFIYSISERISEIKNLDAPKINIAVQYTIDFIKIKQNGLVSEKFDTKNCGIEYHDSFEILRKLTEGTVDSALIISDYAEYYSDYEIIEICEADRNIIVSVDNKFANREYVTINELWNEEFVLYVEGNCGVEMTFLMAEKYCRKYGFNISNISFADNYQTALLNIVSDKNKIVIGEEFLPNFPIDGLVTVPVKNSNSGIIAVINKNLSDEKKKLVFEFYNKMA